MPLIMRLLKRLLVLTPGALFVYVAVRKVFPFFDSRTPVILAVFCTYVVTAYLIIPSMFRLFRLFYQPAHLPLYCTTPDGFASDPINIAVIGDRAKFIAAMEAAGWVQADEKTLHAVSRQIFAAFSGRPYPRAPMSNLYLFGRPQDLSFEQHIEGARTRRHHVRFWSADPSLTTSTNGHAHFWHRFYRPHRSAANATFWVGAASKDIGLAPIRHNAQITHMVDPDTDSERELIVRDLTRAGRLSDSHLITVNQPFRLQNRALRGYLQSDGRLAIVRLGTTATGRRTRRRNPDS